MNEFINEKLVSEMLQNGGLTLNVRNGKTSVLSGFMVSKHESEQVINIAKKCNVSILANIMLYVMHHDIKRGEYLGLWIDNNNLYIDTSKRISTKAEAVRYGKQEKQLAIFDNRTKEVITL